MGSACWATWTWGWNPIQTEWALTWNATGISLFGIRAIGVILLISEGLITLLVLAKIFRITETMDAVGFFAAAAKRKLKR